MSKKCPKCRGIQTITEAGKTWGGKPWYTCLRCHTDYDDFEKLPEITIFDRITASEEVLAPCFVEKQPDKWDDDDYPYYSYLTKEWYATEDKAITATVVRLKEICDE